jgi:predicted nuclease with RNAse H fold
MAKFMKQSFFVKVTRKHGLLLVVPPTHSVGNNQAKGIEIDRSGSKLLVEVYPGATLRNWKLDTTGYRISPEARSSLLEQLEQLAPWLEISSFRAQMIESADCFDAVIAALAAIAVYLGNYNKPTAEQLGSAKVEGWICLPSDNLEKLVD